MMRYVDGETIHRLLDYPGLVAALRSAHAAETMPQVHASVMTDTGDAENKFVSLVAWASGDTIAVKLVGVFPANTGLAPPQPSVQGVVALMSGVTGGLIMTADGAALTFRKTAADSALGADFLARRDARTLLVLGAGGLAPHMIAAHRAVRPTIGRVLLWNRTRQRADTLAAQLGATSVSDLDAALAQADIISCVTMATEPLVRGRLLRPGAHVDLVGAYLPNMREADDEVVRRAGKIFVDTRVGSEGSGEIAEPLARGLIRQQDIVADLFDLCSGRHPGRRNEDEITMYKNVGGGHLDLFTARHALKCVEA